VLNHKAIELGKHLTKHINDNDNDNDDDDDAKGRLTCR